jgi:hypothetical protein
MVRHHQLPNFEAAGVSRPLQKGLVGWSLLPVQQVTEPLTFITESSSNILQMAGYTGLIHLVEPIICGIQYFVSISNINNTCAMRQEISF